MVGDRLNIWLVFDSRALHDRLARPHQANIDHATAEALRHIHHLAGHYHVSVVWVPGHAGLPLNEAADQAAKHGTTLQQPETKPSYRAVMSQLNRQLFSTCARARYLDTVPLDNLHRRISDGHPPPTPRSYTRKEFITVCQLRANRAPFLQATLHRWGRVPSPACPHCGAEQEDSEHFVLHCPKWAEERRQHLGLGPHDITAVLHDDTRGVLRLVEAAGFGPPYAL